MEHSPVCHLLRVPPEIRSLIYQWLFHAATLYIPGANKPPFERRLLSMDGRAIITQSSRQDRSAQILQSCRDIYAEAARALYSQVTIEYNLLEREAIKWNLSTRVCNENLRTCLQERYLQLIPRLTIRSKLVFDSRSLDDYSIDEGMRLFGKLKALKVLTLDSAYFEAQQDLDKCKEELRGSSRENPGCESPGGVATMRNFEKALEEGRVIDGPLGAVRLREVLRDAGRHFEVVLRVGVRMQGHGRWQKCRPASLSWPPNAAEDPHEGGSDKAKIRLASDDCDTIKTSSKRTLQLGTSHLGRLTPRQEGHETRIEVDQWLSAVMDRGC